LIQKKQDYLLCPTASLLEGYLHPQPTSLHKAGNLRGRQKLVRNCLSLFQIKSILLPAQPLRLDSETCI